jgi:hypothetical protein
MCEYQVFFYSICEYVPPSRVALGLQFAWIICMTQKINLVNQKHVISQLRSCDLSRNWSRQVYLIHQVVRGVPVTCSIFCNLFLRRHSSIFWKSQSNQHYCPPDVGLASATATPISFLPHDIHPRRSFRQHRFWAFYILRNLYNGIEALEDLTVDDSKADNRSSQPPLARALVEVPGTGSSRRGWMMNKPGKGHGKWRSLVRSRARKVHAQIPGPTIQQRLRVHTCHGAAHDEPLVLILGDAPESGSTWLDGRRLGSERESLR